MTCFARSSRSALFVRKTRAPGTTGAGTESRTVPSRTVGGPRTTAPVSSSGSSVQKASPSPERGARSPARRTVASCRCGL